MATTKRGRPKGSKTRKTPPPESTPRKEKAIEAKEWLQKIDMGKKVKEEWRKNFRIDLCYEYFEGRHRPQNIPASEWITINLIYSDLRTILPSLYSTDPYYHVKVKKSRVIHPMEVARMEQKAKIRQSMINYLKGEVDLKKKSRVSIFDSMFRFGVTKTLFKADRIANANAGKAVLDENERPMIDPDTGNPMLEPDWFLENEKYDTERIHPDDFLVDDNAGPLEDNVRWMAHRMKRHIDDVRKDSTRNAEYRKFVKATEMLSESDKATEQRKKGAVYNQSKTKKEAEIVVEWEIWDLRNRQWLVVAEGCDYFGIEPEDYPAGIEKHPFNDLRFMLRDSSWYPLPPVSQLIDPMSDYCFFRSKLKTHLKRFNRKYQVYVQGLADEKNDMAKLESGDDGTIIAGTQPVITPTVAPIADAPLDQQIHTAMAYLRKDFDDLSTGANQRGATQGVDSATEAGIIEKRVLIREGDAVATVIDYLESIGRKLDQLVQAHITGDMAIRVVGPAGENWEVVREMDYKAIEGEFDYSIEVGSTQPQLPEIERAQMLGFLQIIAGPGIMLALEPLLFKKLAESFGLDDSAVEAAGRLAQKMLEGQVPVPGQQGSAPGTGGTPQAAQGGQAGGMANIRGGPQ